MPTSIVLSTLNARYIHSALGLRYLMANMDRHGYAGLQERTVLREFTIGEPSDAIARTLLSILTPLPGPSACIIGFGVYIWNTEETAAAIRAIRAIKPDVVIVLGGPEVSFESEHQDVTALSDYVIKGWGDVSFPQLCARILDGHLPPEKLISGIQPPLDQIALPYAHYGPADLENRFIYVEASRGCPFKCEFCLSALDKTAWDFPLEPFLEALDDLFQRGARQFKFVDRTFNLKTETTIRILEFFLARREAGLFVHFELIPDHLPDRLKTMLSDFPVGMLQFEIGIQSFDTEVQKRISRRQDNVAALNNLSWLATHTGVHLHADLIFGLPGETLSSFGAGFDQLYRARPHEIQVGALKRLRGAPIIRHAETFELHFDSHPPYTILSTSTMPAEAINQLRCFASYWNRIANSGRFKQTLSLWLDAPETISTPGAASPFFRFLAFSDWLWSECSTTRAKLFGIGLEALVDALFQYLTGVAKLNMEAVRAALLHDYLASGARGRPDCLKGNLISRPPSKKTKGQNLSTRQRRHTVQSMPG